MILSFYYFGRTVHLRFYSSLLFLSSITNLSVRVLTCMQTHFVPLRRLNVAVPEAVTVTPEHYLSLLPLIRLDKKYFNLVFTSYLIILIYKMQLM